MHHVLLSSDIALVILDTHHAPCSIVVRYHGYVAAAAVAHDDDEDQEAVMVVVSVVVW